MFLAHLPAGYLISATLEKRLNVRGIVTAGLIGSILPDVDMFYFYFIDKQQHLHHSYWTHIPIFWFLLACLCFTMIFISRCKNWLLPTSVFFLNIFIHLLLDTVVGKIEWLQPFSKTAFYFFDVEARYDWYVWNFVLHWTFLLEVFIILSAGYMFWKRRREISETPSK